MYDPYIKVSGISLYSKFHDIHCCLSSLFTVFFLEAITGKLFLLFAHAFAVGSVGQSWWSLFFLINFLFMAETLSLEKCASLLLSES